jgi:hypothetical protein
VEKIFASFMEDQIPASQAPEPTQRITPEELEAMKAFAREQAIRMTYQQPPLTPQPPVSNLPYQPRPDIPQMQKAPEPAYDFSAPKVIYVRRNLTVAEILAICVISCVVVGGIQGFWGFASKYLPQIEVQVK